VTPVCFFRHWRRLCPLVDKKVPLAIMFNPQTIMFSLQATYSNIFIYQTMDQWTHAWEGCIAYRPVALGRISEINSKLKGIVSRDFVVCFLMSFDRSDISTHQKRVLLLLKVRFRIKFLDFRVWPWWAQEGKWRVNMSKYWAHTQDILLLFLSIITENPVKKNGAKSWACKKSYG
jgi:hypothetical protein